MIAALDIGGTKTAIGLVDGHGQLLVDANIPTQPQRGPKDAMRRILDVLRSQIKAADEELLGIGIGCTGPVDPITGELGDVNTLPGWRGWNPVREVASIFQVSAAMENDADAAVLGELRWGSYRGKKNLIYITVGTGIGAGIVLDGRLYRGAHGSHPELGHQIIEPLGPSCTCGATGCWESVASGPALEDWFAREYPEIKKMTAKEICSWARTGDIRALHAVERLGTYLGMGLANVISMFMPETIILGGSVMNNSDLFLPKIRTVIRDNCRLVPLHKCDIVLSSLGNAVGLIGAAQVWCNRF